MGRFQQIKIDKTTSFKKEGMEINAYISGVNSGQYSLPFVIKVKVWSRKWFFEKFFYREMKLDLDEIKILMNECQNVLRYYEEKEKEMKSKQGRIIEQTNLIQKAYLNNATPNTTSNTNIAD